LHPDVFEQPAKKTYSTCWYGVLIGLRRVTAVEAEKTGIDRRSPLWKRLQAGGDLLVRKQQAQLT